MSLEAIVEQAAGALAARPAALISDIDGTLSRIVPRPSDAVVSEQARQSLAALLPLLDLVAAVTGREEAVARRMVACEGLTYVGSYGLDAGSAARVAASDLGAAKESARELLAAYPCVTLEEKDVSFALHYRNCADGETVRQALIALLEPIAAAAGGRLLEGKQVIELVPAALPGKDDAVANLARDHQLKGIVYLGDDLSDTAVFRAIATRRTAGQPGLAIAVVDSETRGEVRDAADATLAGVSEVEAFLAALAQRLGR